ncbi:MAG: tRNA lysidine(34) synthetase TilS [Dethiobacteria bacterium]|jgi:tRNA(Ile)-lysidine synthase
MVCNQQERWLVFRESMFQNSPLYLSVKKTILQEQLINKGDRVVIAVSGGADSLSLLILLNRLRREPDLPFSLHVAHLDHGLRGKSAAGDAKFVRRMAKKLGLPCSVGIVQAEHYKRSRGLSLEDAARQLRYGFLEQLAARVGANCIVVGHNRDDQVETVLLNFLRGSGPDGLAGMNYSRKIGESGVALVRPLLNIKRREIEEFCWRYGFRPRLDETNKDPRFLRNRIRKEILPLLEKVVNPRLREGIFRLSQLFSLDRDCWEQITTDRLLAIQREGGPDSLTIDRQLFLGEHASLQGRIIRLVVKKLLGSIPREVGFHRIQATLDLINREKPRGAVHFPHGLIITRDYQKIKAFLPAVHREEKRSRQGCQTTFLPIPGEVGIAGYPHVILRASLSEACALVWPPDEERVAYLDFDKVFGLASAGEGLPPGGNNDMVLLVRRRQPGDRFYPLGAPGRKKLKDFFINHKISWRKRDFIPLVIAGEEIVWVVGRQISHLCRITEDTKKVIVLSLETA